jgi:hypothetical protein
MKTMKNLMGLVMAAIVMVVVFVSCGKEGFNDHSSWDEAKGKFTATPTPTPTPTPKDSLWENSWVAVDTTVINLDWLYFKNDTVVDSLKNHTNVAGQVVRKEDKLETTVNHLNNLGITAGQVVESRDGKMNYVYRQTMTDLDGQTYNGEFKSGYASLKDLKNVHGKLVGFQTTGFRNIPQPTPEDMDTLVLTRVGWKATFEVENGKNLAGQQFEIALDSTDHFRYIPKGAPTIIGTSLIKYKIPGNWESKWVIGKRYFWSNNTVTADSMFVPLKGSYSKIELKDKVVGSLEYTHDDGSVKWGERYAVASNDNRIKLYERKGTKKSYATNGISADQFYTEFAVTIQDAIVEFCDSTWTIGADEASLTTKRNIFAEATSDMEGYSMVKFVDEEIAKWNGAYEQTLDESCKLYLKLAEPEIIDYMVDGSDYKTRTENSVKVGLTIKPKYDNGTFGKEIPFKMERAESWVWLKDSVIYENVDFFMQETASKLELVGDLKKTARTQKDNGGVFSFNEYEGDFRAKVTSNGMTKYTTWHAIWSEDFSFTYTDENGKTFSHTFNKSDYNAKAQNASLKKNESKSSVTSEVYDYSVDGIFAIDNVNRSAKGYGRFQKAIEEKVIRTYWDETSKGQSHTVLQSTRWATLVREYNTGKKTTQEYKHVFNRLSGSSKWEITAEEGSEAANGSMILENANEENRADDFAHFTLKKFELGQYFDVPGAAQQHDKVTFTESMGAYFEAKDQDGNPIKVYFEDPSYSFTNNVKALTVKSENDSETVYQHENVVNWNFGGAMTQVSATGLIHVAKSQETPDFDMEVGKIYATVSRPSNRNASDITAYTYLLVSKDGKKCLPLGFYNGVITVDEKNGIVDYVPGMNSACYVKDQNRVVATRAYSDSGLGMMIWCGADGNPVDAASHLVLQGAGFNNRGNDWVNHTGKYAPRATKKNGVTVVTFEGTNVSYTFRGWNV